MESELNGRVSGGLGYLPLRNLKSQVFDAGLKILSPMLLWADWNFLHSIHRTVPRARSRPSTRLATYSITAALSGGIGVLTMYHVPHLGRAAPV